MPNKNNDGIILLIALVAIIGFLYYTGALKPFDLAPSGGNINWVTTTAGDIFPVYIATYNGTSAVPATLYVNYYNNSGGLIYSTQITTSGSIKYPTQGGLPAITGGAPSKAFSATQMQYPGTSQSTIYLNGSIGDASTSPGVFTKFVWNVPGGVSGVTSGSIMVIQSLNGKNYTLYDNTGINFVQPAGYYYPQVIVLPVLLSAPGATTTIAQGSVSAPSSPSVSTSSGFFNSIEAYFQGFLNYILSINVPFSVGLPAGPYYTGIAIPAQVNLTIPANFRTVQANGVATHIVSTYCDDFITNSTGKVYNNTPSLATGSYYTVSFSYTPKAPGTYGFADVCVATNNTYSNGVWAGWTSPVLVAQDNATITVSLQGGTQGGTTSTISSPPPVILSNISQAISGFINSIVQWFENLFKGL